MHPYQTAYATVPTPRRSNSNNEYTRNLITLVIVVLVVLYLFGIAFGFSFLFEEDDLVSPRVDEFQRLRINAHVRSVEKETREDASCRNLLDSETQAKRLLENQVRKLENELSDLKTRYREMENEYRDLVMKTRNAPTKPATVNVGDVSALQRLTRCKQQSTDQAKTITELTDLNSNLEGQVSRMQKELREAVADADLQENLVAECEKKLKKHAM